MTEVVAEEAGFINKKESAGAADFNIPPEKYEEVPNDEELPF